MHTIELLTPEKVVDMWPALEPFFDAACRGNEIAKDEMDAKDLYVLATTGVVAVFVMYEDSTPACILGIQFYEVNGHKGADVVALAGRNLLKAKNAYWQYIINWLKANKVEFLDAYTTDRLAKVFMKRFGFNKSCVYIRMNLQGDCRE